MIFVWTSRVSSRHFGLSRMSFTCFGSRYVRGIGLEGSWRVGLCEVERNIFHLKLIQPQFHIFTKVGEEDRP